MLFVFDERFYECNIESCSRLVCRSEGCQLLSRPKRCGNREFVLRSSRNKDLLVFQQLPAPARGAIVASVSGGSLGFAPFQTRPMPLSEDYTSKARRAPKTHGVLFLRLGQPLQDSQIEGRACWSRVEFARMNGGLGNSGRPVGFGIEPSAEISIPPSDTIPVGATALETSAPRKPCKSQICSIRRW